MFCPASLVCAPVVQEQNVGEHEKDSRRHRDVPCDGDDTRDLNHDIGHSDDERSASSPVNGCFSVCLCARLVKYGQKFGFWHQFSQANSILGGDEHRRAVVLGWR
jgi:hypothetical protein